MAGWDLRFNVSEADAAIETLRSSVPAGITRSLNRAVVSARAYMSTAIAKDLGIKTGTVKDAIRIEEARQGKEEARVISSGSRIPLVDFQAKGPYPSRGRGVGVTARMRGQRKVYPHTFIAQMRSGHRGVFSRSRRNAPRLPIRERFGPSLPYVFHKHSEAGLARGQEILITNLRHEMRRAVSLRG